MFNYAKRIQARAVRRAGELLKQFDGQGKRSDLETSDDSQPKSRKEAGDEAGFTDYKRKQAVNVANVDEESFNEQVDSDNPPSVNQLSEQGKQKRECLVILFFWLWLTSQNP